MRFSEFVILFELQAVTLSRRNNTECGVADVAILASVVCMRSFSALMRINDLRFASRGPTEYVALEGLQYMLH